MVNIRPPVDSFVQSLEFWLDKRSPGNIMARTRMIFLYTNAMNRFILRTGNRREFLTGYSTKWMMA